MERKTKAKWFFLGLGAGWLPIIAVAIFILVQYNRGERHDPFDGVRPDMGEKVYKFWRPATGVSSVTLLGDTSFQAVVGPSFYQDEDDKDWDFYTISVEKQDGDSSYVFFKRQFKMNEVPADLVNKKAQDITTFDDKSGVVTFLIGTSTHTYKLPNR